MGLLKRSYDQYRNDTSFSKRPMNNSASHYSWDESYEIIVVGKMGNVSRIIDRQTSNILIEDELGQNGLHMSKVHVTEGGEPLMNEQHRSNGSEGYSTRDVANFFGVTEERIKQWMEDGKFEQGVEHLANGRAIFSKKSVWITRGGQRIKLVDLEQEYVAKQSARHSAQEQADISGEISKFVSKYNGTYEEVFGVREPLSFEEEHDATLWRHLLDLENGVN